MVNDYMIGTASNCTTATEISTGDITGTYDYFIGEPEKPKIKSQKMEVELCLCSKALWS